ncbi:MAG: energy-coupling factor ABC transporter permease [Caldilineaceae bacterium]|nr:energy-coupling factor ABC transporter permease [Caldilineaceae bacterium]MBP8110540.1 energy-coupling factor ABC transporter permease [Caldilineaceae bacterium]MBP8125554.1 energy-coupling factor ABC transporter permease [Caldilineaceae bacterium]MBP9075156.1 energy-coupling factor ABC transporter permease [Caldilineaceae bacterium]
MDLTRFLAHNPTSELVRGVADTAKLHIPDGFLSPLVSVFFWVIVVALLAVAVRRSEEELGERQIPLAGIMAAFIFAAQMINFPVAGGTSGHLLGGALAAIVLGPWAGMLVMTAVIGVQGLLFQDGGLVVMGANIFNMGLLTVIIGYGLYRGAAGRSRTVKLAVAGVAAWLSVMAGALATSLQLWLSGTALLAIVMPTMLGIHALIGLGEALITVAALSFVMRTRPDLLGEEDAAPKGGRGWVVAGGLTALVVVLLSPFASANPDGLERVAMDLGFINRGAEAPFSILSDYAIPWLNEGAGSTILAGAVGALVVAAIAAGLTWFMRRRHRSGINVS